MRSCQRLYAPIERSHEVGNRTPRIQCLGDNSADSSKHVLDAMVELRNQYALLFLHPFSLSYVNADADDSVRTSAAVVSDETTRLDPTHLATCTNDTILYAIFAPARLKRHAAGLFHLLYVVVVHANQAFAAAYLDSAFRKAVEGRIAFRNLHDLRVGVICVAANESRLSCERQLDGAFAQGQLGFSALSDISRQALDTQQPARITELGSRRFFQPDLASIPTAKAERQYIRRVARA